MTLVNFLADHQEVIVLIGSLVTAGVILVGRGWRPTLFSLLALYLLMWLLLSSAVPGGVAVVKPLVGLMVFLILYPAGWRLPQERQPSASTWPFRLAMLILALVVGFGLQLRFPWPELPTPLGYTPWWLMMAGLFTALLAVDPFRTGLGLLLLETGFEAGFTVLEPGLLVAGFLGLLQIVMALATSYLTTARAAAPPAASLPRGGTG